jgi:hypothetical protein
VKKPKGHVLYSPDERKYHLREEEDSIINKQKHEMVETINHSPRK